MITHDLGVIAEVADEVLVMYAGRAVEYGTTKQLLTAPAMPYTLGLIQSVPDLQSDVNEPLRPIPGNPPSLLDPPTGCAFAPRCTFAHLVPDGLPFTVMPELEEIAPGHLRRCHLAEHDLSKLTPKPAEEVEVA
jgi:peptide/nickel transport system ATP-binding protein